MNNLDAYSSGYCEGYREGHEEGYRHGFRAGLASYEQYDNEAQEAASKGDGERKEDGI